jgi:hypothetical protein
MVLPMKLNDLSKNCDTLGVVQDAYRFVVIIFKELWAEDNGLEVRT